MDIKGLYGLCPNDTITQYFNDKEFNHETMPTGSYCCTLAINSERNGEE